MAITLSFNTCEFSDLLLAVSNTPELHLMLIQRFVDSVSDGDYATGSYLVGERQEFVKLYFDWTSSRVSGNLKENALSGRKIPVIKIIREKTGLGLYEAKQLAESAFNW